MTTFFMIQYQHPDIADFADFLKFEKRFSVHTTRAYIDDLTGFFQFSKDQFDTDQLNQLNPMIIRSWMASLTLIKLSPRSVNRKISSLKSFFKFCMIQGRLQTNPAKNISVLKTNKRLPSFVEADQMEKLLKGNFFDEGNNTKQDRLILTLLYHTGMRVSELVGLKTVHIELNRNQIKVLGKGNKERIIPISDELKLLIQESINEKKSNGFEPQPELLVTGKGKAFNPRQIYQIVKYYLSQVTTAEKKSPHVLRHSFATHLTSNGAELNAVKELLGHSSLAATQVYTHNSIERLRDIHKKAHPKG